MRRKKTRILPILFIITCCFFSCRKQITHSDKQSEFQIIDFEKSIETKQQMFISEIADSVEYIELKTPNNIIITKISQVIPIKDSLLILAKGFGYLFHKNGEFIRPIGTRGLGPEEYLVTAAMDYNFDKREILISGINGLIFYKLNGDFIKNKKFDFISRFGISDSILWISQGQHCYSKYRAYAFSLNDSEDTVAYLTNNYYGIKPAPEGGATISASGPMFYHKNNLLYFYGDEPNDTIWEVSGTTLKPHTFINMGKYKMPIEHESWYSWEAFEKNAEKYWCIPNIIEDDRYFFFLSQSSNFRNLEKGRFRNVTEDYVVYDKKKNRGFAAKDSNGKKITDDIAGGPSIWPRWMSDDYYIDAIEWHDLIEQIETGKYTPNVPLQELLSRIGEDTNELIILCHRK